MPKPCLVVSAVLVAALAAAPAASAKGDVTDRISVATACPATAAATVTVAFALTTADGKPFGAADIFVRFKRAAGKPSFRRDTRSAGAGRSSSQARLYGPLPFSDDL